MNADIPDIFLGFSGFDGLARLVLFYFEVLSSRSNTAP